MEAKPLRIRLDMALVEAGLAPSREKAKVLIMAGEVRVNGQLELKADKPVIDSDELTLIEKYPYVSRGAFKLEAAVKCFSFPMEGQRVLDVGISTGGFSDYLLQHGAAAVIGVDVNVKQVADSLRSDQRVHLIEKNIKNLVPADLPFQPDWVVIDLSFISILRALSVLTFLSGTPILGMVKPQFESPKGQVGKGGVVRDSAKVIKILVRLCTHLKEMGYGVMGIAPAGIKGKKGNQEYFLHLRYGQPSSVSDTMVVDAVKTV